MKYVLLGTLSADWAERHGERTDQAKAKLAELGIKLQSVHYTQGEVDFVDIVDAPDPNAMLAFSIWVCEAGLRPVPLAAGVRRRDHAQGPRQGLRPSCAAAAPRAACPRAAVSRARELDGCRPCAIFMARQEDGMR